MGKSPTNTTKNGDSTKAPAQPQIDITHAASPITKADDTVKTEAPGTKAEPLAPPPRPETTVGNTPDYFSAAHTNPAPHLESEANPFEFSFANGNNGDIQTPGGTKLPSVAALTSPALPGGFATPSFWGSLRSGPLSPAMLSGPAKDDYFSDNHHMRGGFPTPNESSMRSGLTPGGGGSMFPEPSPGALLGFGSGGATPSTLDFQRTALNAANMRKEAHPVQQNVTSQPQGPIHTHDVKPPNGRFDQHDPNEAANSLYMLANNGNNPQPASSYAVASSAPVHGHPQPGMNMANRSHEVSPTMAHRANGSISTSSIRGVSEMSASDNEQQSRPNTRGKGKRSSTQMTQANGRGKAQEAPPKASASKKSKTNNGNAHSMPEPEEEEQEVLDMTKDEYNANGKKMTDEEKRKNFLERNRVAALKCRQRKKQWLANLQSKVEAYSHENDMLNTELSRMKNEMDNLKAILVAHKDCALGQQQGLPNILNQQVMEGYNTQMNPYNMAGMPPQMPSQMQQQRRYS